ncbi:homocysteine S-methyltransferase [Lentzea sp. BCCO 10_0798]|uniref:Homocysteine S-methyltransferase n=1 Tax=Lentzea kristufekii TaxID=3095430 RepID=A0ABU4TU11_9PSEU|nr:homocysteine S-methyltransferase [Lentzea sp. BCCO 10_0798]MDX8051785.1 homocysteine S-methyltransferase [Lentzea sp. BCCO 10_0798]
MELAEALARRAVVLDGGMSTALELAGHDLSDELWSARLLLTDPDAVRAAHLAYYRAGAEVAITASYQASFEGFARRGISETETARLLRSSVELARSAASEMDGPRWVAASVGPYGAVLADGSEYRGRYGLSRQELVRFHAPRIETLCEAGPDVLAVETVPDVDEAEAVLEVVRGSGVPVWLSFTVRGDRTCAGQPLEEAFAVAAGVDEVIAVGVNCCAPQDVAGAVAVARRVSGLPVVVYPNSGEQWDAAARSWSGDGGGFAAQAVDWVGGGARLVGGCCRTGPDAIAVLAEGLAAAR